MIPIIRTESPIRDAEQYQCNLREAESSRESIECDICHGNIYRADTQNYGDDVYEIDGMNICEDCILAYIKDKRRELQ